MAEEMRIVLRNYGKIDPLKIEDYINVGGYQSLAKARNISQKEVIDEVKIQVCVDAAELVLMLV